MDHVALLGDLVRRYFSLIPTSFLTLREHSFRSPADAGMAENRQQFEEEWLDEEGAGEVVRSCTPRPDPRQKGRPSIVAKFGLVGVHAKCGSRGRIAVADYRDRGQDRHS
jgi:hypothetical protein